MFSSVSTTYPRLTTVDTAREAYSNATAEAIAVLRYMSDREKHMQASWDGSNAVLGVSATFRSR